MILAAMQSAALRAMGQRPQPMFGGAGQLEMELCDLVNEVATDVAKYQDWQALTRTGAIAGDGTTTAFPLPTDYDRMLLDSAVMDSASWAWGYARFYDVNEFMAAQGSGFAPAPGAWILVGNQMQFVPAPSATAIAVFPYITANWALSASGVAKPAFTADDDTYLLPERLLTLGLVWRWRENKKLDALGDQEAFIKALDEYGAKDRGSRVQRRNSRGFLPGVGLAYPGTLG